MTHLIGGVIINNIFNLDVGNIRKTTDFAYKVDNKVTMYYRLCKNGYLVDMNNFEKLTLRFNDVVNNEILTVVYTTMVTINGQKLVEVIIPQSLTNSNTKLLITPSVKLSNITSNLKEFKLLVFDYNKAEMNIARQAISRFNYMYGQYLISVKKDQIDKPNGVVSLDSNGRIDYNKLQSSLGNHVFEKIRTSKVHGMTLNDKFLVEYYDNDDEAWYEANSIFGGIFGYSNKPEQYNIFGGTWDSIELIDVDGGTFGDNLVDAYSGGTFTDTTSSNGIHAGTF